MVKGQENRNTFMDTNLELFSGLEHKVADLSQKSITFGRKEIELALHESEYSDVNWNFNKISFF